MSRISPNVESNCHFLARAGVVGFFVSMHLTSQPGWNGDVHPVVVFLFALLGYWIWEFVEVFTHELGHAFGAWHVGGRVREIYVGGGPRIFAGSLRKSPVKIHLFPTHGWVRSSEPTLNGYQKNSAIITAAGPLVDLFWLLLLAVLFIFHFGNQPLAGILLWLLIVTGWRFAWSMYPRMADVGGRQVANDIKQLLDLRKAEVEKWRDVTFLKQTVNQCRKFTSEPLAVEQKAEILDSWAAASTWTFSPTETELLEEFVRTPELTTAERVVVLLNLAELILLREVDGPNAQQLKKADSWTAEAMKLFPENALCRLLRALTEFFQGNLDVAKEILESLRESEEAVPAHAWLALIHFRQNQSEDKIYENLRTAVDGDFRPEILIPFFTIADETQDDRVIRLFNSLRHKLLPLIYTNGHFSYELNLDHLRVFPAGSEPRMVVGRPVPLEALSEEPVRLSGKTPGFLFGKIVMWSSIVALILLRDDSEKVVLCLLGLMQGIYLVLNGWNAPGRIEYERSDGGPRMILNLPRSPEEESELDRFQLYLYIAMRNQKASSASAWLNAEPFTADEVVSSTD